MNYNEKITTNNIKNISTHCYNHFVSLLLYHFFFSMKVWLATCTHLLHHSLFLNISLFTTRIKSLITVIPTSFVYRPPIISTIFHSPWLYLDYLSPFDISKSSRYIIFHFPGFFSHFQTFFYEFIPNSILPSHIIHPL